MIVGPQKAWLSWLHLFDFNTQSAFGNVCLTPLSASDVMGLSLLMPFVFFAELTVAMLFHFALARCCRISQASRVGFDSLRYRRCFAALFLSSYTQFATACFRYLVFLMSLLCSQLYPFQSCDNVAGISVVTQQPAVHCDDTRYKSWLVLLIFILVGDVVLSPVALTAFLCAHRDKLDDRHQANTRAFHTAFGVFFEPFSDRTRFVSACWQALILLRRMMVSAIAAVSSPAIRYMAFAVSFICCGVLHASVRPFSTDLMNTMESVGICVHVFLSVLLCGFASDLQRNGRLPVAMQATISLLVVVPSVVFLALVAKSFIDSKKAERASLSRPALAESAEEFESEYMPMSVQ